MLSLAKEHSDINTGAVTKKSKDPLLPCGQTGFAIWAYFLIGLAKNKRKKKTKATVDVRKEKLRVE